MHAQRITFVLLALAGCGAGDTAPFASRRSQHVRYIHNTVNAGPTMLTRADGTVEEERRFEPFGAELDSYRTVPTGPNPTPTSGLVGFERFDMNALNKRTDVDTRWSDHGARWMAPDTGRWLTPDPPVKLPEQKYLLAFQELHPYQYVSQNPVAFWDPDGREREPKATLGLDDILPPNIEATTLIAGHKRAFEREDGIRLLERTFGRKLTPQEIKTFERGCVGITALLVGESNPMANWLAYGARDGDADGIREAHKNAVADATSYNQAAMRAGRTADWVVVAMRFHSRGQRDVHDEVRGEPFAPMFGTVDLRGLGWDADGELRYPSSAADNLIRFDFGFYDASTSTFLHGNASRAYAESVGQTQKLFQSTLAGFMADVPDFDTVVFMVVQAKKPPPGAAPGTSSTVKQPRDGQR